MQGNYLIKIDWNTKYDCVEPSKQLLKNVNYDNDGGNETT